MNHQNRDTCDTSAGSVRIVPKSTIRLYTEVASQVSLIRSEADPHAHHVHARHENFFDPGYPQKSPRFLRSETEGLENKTLMHLRPAARSAERPVNARSEAIVLASESEVSRVG